MAVYQIRIDEKKMLGKNLLALLQSVPQVVSFEKQKKEKMPESELYKSLDRAFADVRLMLDGKKKEKTVEEFLDEL